MGSHVTDGDARPPSRFVSVRLSSCAVYQGVRPPRVSGVGAWTADLGAHNQASGESWGCLSVVHSPGAEGGGAPEAKAAEETSLPNH